MVAGTCTFGRRVALAAAAFASAPGCLFTSDINAPPVAEIARLDEAETLHLGDTLRLSGSKSIDRDGERLVYAWSARSCESMQSCSMAFQSQTSADPLFEVEIPSKQLIAVSLRVTDERGAAADDAEFYAVANRAPEIGELQVQGALSPAGAYTIGRAIELYVAAADADGDSLTYTWQLYPAAGSVPEDAEWTELSATGYRLRADVAGLWNVSVEVDDGDGGTDTEQRVILVDVDRPPCITTTDPLAPEGARYVLGRGDGARRLAVVSVVDELDPFPRPPDDAQLDRGEARFAWHVASPATGGELTAVPGHGLADYVIDPADFAPGDRLAARGEGADRERRPFPCAARAPTRPIGDDGCLQRVTWEVEVR